MIRILVLLLLITGGGLLVTKTEVETVPPASKGGTYGEVQTVSPRGTGEDTAESSYEVSGNMSGVQGSGNNSGERNGEVIGRNETSDKNSVSRGGVNRSVTHSHVFEITAYNDYGKTASGTTVTEGRTIAADWRVLPPGTVVEIEGIGTRVVEDSGGAVIGNVIDVYMNKSDAELMAFGRQWRNVKIIYWGGKRNGT